MEATTQLTLPPTSWSHKAKSTQWVEEFLFQPFCPSETQTPNWPRTNQRRSFVSSIIQTINIMDMVQSRIKWKCNKRSLVADNKASLSSKRKETTVRGPVKMRATQLADLSVAFQAPNSLGQMQRRTSRFLNNKIIISITIRWCEIKQTSLELTIPKMTASEQEAENIIQLQASAHNLRTAISHQLVKEIAHKIQMTSMDKTTISSSINNQSECWISAKTTTVQDTHRDRIARSELEGTCSLRVDPNRTMVMDNTVTKCNSKCHIKIAHHMEVSHSQVMVWIKCQAKSEALL